MRSVIGAANAAGIEAIVAQQFEIGAQIVAAGLVPIIEPEITISIADKADAEKLLLSAVLKHLDALPADSHVMLKLTLARAAWYLRASWCNHPACCACRGPVWRLFPR